MSNFREYQADFDTPNSVVAGASTERRPDAISFDFRTAFALGPVAVQDPSQGIFARVWRVRVDGPDVFLARANDAGNGWDSETLLFSYEGPPIDEVDLAFTSNGDPVVCAERSGEVWIRFFDATQEATVFLPFGEGRCPRAVYDRATVQDEADVTVFYVSLANDCIEYRLQRDRFATPYSTPVVGAEGLYVEDAAHDSSNRLRIIYSRRSTETGKYSLHALVTVLPVQWAQRDTVTPEVSVFLEAVEYITDAPPAGDTLSVYMVPTAELRDLTIERDSGTDVLHVTATASVLLVETTIERTTQADVLNLTLTLLAEEQVAIDIDNTATTETITTGVSVVATLEEI